MSYETRYAAHMRMKADAAASTPEARVARLALASALSLARDDVAQRYPVLTLENAGDVMEYQAERIAHWRAVLKA